VADWNDKADRKGTTRAFEFALFGMALAWAVCANHVAGSAAAGIAGRFRWTYGQGLLQGVFFLFLATVGFRVVDRLDARGRKRPAVLALPRRKTSVLEWGTSAAIGWGLCLTTLLPALLSGHYHTVLNGGPGAVPAFAIAILTLLVATLADEAVFRGYPFARLERAIGPSLAALTMSLLFSAVLTLANPPRSLWTGLFNGALLGLLLAMAYLRTHALWVGWGLHFSYRAVMALVLGLPFAGRRELGSLMDGSLSGPSWLSGGTFGLGATLFTAIVFLAGVPVLYQATRDWAWAYTVPDLVPAGYEVTVAPPAAHVAMEKAVAPPPLVQILTATPQGFSAPANSDPPPRPDALG
jgi:membrane protease YdiL (CAAX protease family)